MIIIGFILNNKQESQESQEIHVKKFELKQNGQTLDENGVLEMTLETEEDVEGYGIYVSFRCKNTSYSGTREYYFYPNSANKKEFKMNYTVGTNYSDGTWILQSIYTKKNSLEKKEYLNITDIGVYKYTVKKTVTNFSKPIITSVSLDKNRETLSVGDKVNITIEAISDKCKLSECGEVDFYPVSHIANATKSVDVYYDDEKGVYEGVFEITEDIYPCEWYLNGIDIQDTKGHTADSVRL